MGKREQILPAGRRSERFGRLLQQEISGLLRKEIKDTRISNISIVDVVASDDLRHAKIYYTALEDDPEKREEIQAGLEKAAGFLRGHLGRTLHIRYAPQLHFQFDRSLDYGSKIDSLLNDLIPDKEEEDGD